MTTIWDQAVRAATVVLNERGGAGPGTSPLSYFCGGPERRCDHRACTVVCALADADLLDYAAGDAVPFTQLDRVARAVGLALGETGTTAMCHVNLECSHTPCEIVRRLLARNVLATGAPAPAGDTACDAATMSGHGCTGRVVNGQCSEQDDHHPTPGMVPCCTAGWPCSAPEPPAGVNERGAGWAGGDADLERFVRALVEDMHRRGLLADELSEKVAARTTVALMHAFGLRDLGVLADRLRTPVASPALTTARARLLDAADEVVGMYGTAVSYNPKVNRLAQALVDVRRELDRG